MRVMVLVKANAASEQEVFPSAGQMAAMDRFNDELVKAGIRRAAEGLKPTSQALRIVCDGDSRTVIEGPFANPRDLVAGFWLWEVKDMDEALAWAKRCPNPLPGVSDIEIRPLYERSDLV